MPGNSVSECGLQNMHFQYRSTLIVCSSGGMNDKCYSIPLNAKFSMLKKTIKSINIEWMLLKLTEFMKLRFKKFSYMDSVAKLY